MTTYEELADSTGKTWIVSVNTDGTLTISDAPPSVDVDQWTDESY